MRAIGNLIPRQFLCVFGGLTESTFWSPPPRPARKPCVTDVLCNCDISSQIIKCECKYFRPNSNLKKKKHRVFWGENISESSRRLRLSEISCWKGFPASLDAAGKFFPDFPTAPNAIPAKVWALSGKEMAAGNAPPSGMLLNLLLQDCHRLLVEFFLSFSVYYRILPQDKEVAASLSRGRQLYVRVSGRGTG